MLKIPYWVNKKKGEIKGMKKSEIWKKAQLAVLSDSRLSDSDKLEILKELQDKEDTALFIEKREKEEAAANGTV